MRWEWEVRQTNRLLTGTFAYISLSLSRWVSVSPLSSILFNLKPQSLHWLSLSLTIYMALNWYLILTPWATLSLGAPSPPLPPPPPPIRWDPLATLLFYYYLLISLLQILFSFISLFHPSFYQYLIADLL